MNAAKAASARVPGHALRAGGRPFATGGRLMWLEGHAGRALCECGVLSPMLGSNAARRAWHREHKSAVRAAATDPNPTPHTGG